MKKCFMLLLLLPILIAGCEKEKDEPVPDVKCTELTDALLNNDRKKVELEVNRFFDARKPMPDDLDDYGYREHFVSWTEQVEACPNLKITASCYACLQTSPPLAQVTIEVSDVHGQTITRYNLYTSFDRTEKKYLFVGMERF